MIVDTFNPFRGVHCETTATGSLLKQLGIDLSEPMLFGLGEGIGFIYWNMKCMDFPFIGGRCKQDLLTENLCRNLNLDLEVRETASLKKAWANVAGFIGEGKAVGLKLDCYHLEYFGVKIHFAGHYVAMYGYDDESAYLVDTAANGKRPITSLKSLELARSEKGPMSGKNLSYTISDPGKGFDLADAVRKAIRQNANEFLNPPITNIGYKGILKTSKEIKKWFRISKDVKTEFQTCAMLMEEAGTGGALFRNLYRDFLKEAAELLNSDAVAEASEWFAEIAVKWTKVAELFTQAGETGDEKYINEASGVLVELSAREKEAMELLVEL